MTVGYLDRLTVLLQSIWISELATTLPEAVFDAVDISAEQYPPEAFRAPNVSFWTHDCFKPFPKEYLGKFNVVNVKFWLCFINDDVADKVFQNVVTLLSKTAMGKSLFSARYLL